MKRIQITIWLLMMILSASYTQNLSQYEYRIDNAANMVIGTVIELTISSHGNGTVTYDGISLRDQSSLQWLYEGSDVVISFFPDDGYRIISVKVNGYDVTSNIANNTYTISSINEDTIVEVEFEQPDTIVVDGIYYWVGEDNTVSVKSCEVKYSGDVVIPESVEYGGKTYSVTSIGKRAFDRCYGLTSVCIPNSVTTIGNSAFWGCSGLSSVNIPNSVTTIGESVFTACENLTSVFIGNGVTSIGKESFYGCPNLLSIHITNLEAWCRIKFDDQYYSNPLLYAHHLFLNGEEIKALEIPNTVVSINNYAFRGCSGLTSVIIPNSVISIGSKAFMECDGLTSLFIGNNVNTISDYAFQCCSILNSIKVDSSNMYYDSRDNCDAIIETSSNTLIKGCNSTIIPNSVTSIGKYAFYICSSLKSVCIPNSVKSIEVFAFNGCSSLTTIVSEIEKPFMIDNSVFEGIPSDAQLVVPKGTKAAYQATEGWNQFTNIVEAGDVEPDQPGQIHIDDIFYKETGLGEVEVVSVEEGESSVTIPSTILYNNTSYKVTAIAKDAFENSEHLAAVIWEPEAQFNAKGNNPNFLLYVSDEKYASRSVKNVVVNGVAESIELTDAANGNDFYCPRAFRARSIVYSHNYQMETGIGDSRGWETIVLPFDVQKYTHATKGELESFTTWSKGSNKKPFWLFELTASGYKDVAGIKANTPYIISMPNNQQYEQQYQIPGVVTFSASDVEVQKSDNLIPATYQGRTFVPNYTNQNNLDFLALNVSNNYVTNPSKEIAGSKFIRGLRAVHPFEAYVTTTDNTRSIDVMDGMTTAIRGIQMVKVEASVIKVYDTRGVLLKTATNKDDVRNGLKAGVYIVNGKKMIIK